MKRWCRHCSTHHPLTEAFWYLKPRPRCRIAQQQAHRKYKSRPKKNHVDQPRVLTERELLAMTKLKWDRAKSRKVFEREPNCGFGFINDEGLVYAMPRPSFSAWSKPVNMRDELWNAIQIEMNSESDCAVEWKRDNILGDTVFYCARRRVMVRLSYPKTRDPLIKAVRQRGLRLIDISPCDIVDENITNIAMNIKNVIKGAA